MPLLVHEIIAPAGARRWAMVLHGLGDSLAGWQPVAPMLHLADWGFVFVQAPDPYGPGWSWFDLMLPDTRPDRIGVIRSRDRLRELLDHLETTRGIRAEDTSLIGFSQGCLIALDVALRHHRVFAGVVGISGWIDDLEGFPAGFGAAAQRQRILMTHGRFDPVIPITKTAPQAARLKELGLDLRWGIYDKDHGLDPHEEIPDLRRFLVAGSGLPGPARS
jgi:phospholipase/carboxylesterase